MNAPAGQQQKGVQPFYYSHVWKNASLVALSILALPVSAVLVLLSLVVQRVNGRDKVLQAERNSTAVTVAQRKTILVTGVSMAKGLSIARVLSQNTPHRVIGADISPLSPGRFSSAISSYYRLDTPNGDDAEPYIDSILSVIRNEKIDLWISCSSVIAAVEDGQVVRIAQKQAKEAGRRFEAIQFYEDVVEKFHEKDKFIDYIQSLDLLVPESHRVTSPEEALNVLLRNVGNSEDDNKKFIMKPIGVDDHARNAMMTLLPFESPSQTKKYIHSLNISKSNPFQLQQFIKGNEYCTHALVIRGKVKAFCSCPSLELLMHYEPLPTHSKLNQEMLAFTERVVADGGKTFTGHLSFDFLVEDEENVKLYPIECNPRAHTAVVLFEKTPEMAEAYLSVLDYRKDSGEHEKPIFPHTPTSSYYWFGHDVVSFLILPFLDAIFGAASSGEFFDGLATFWHHFSCWKDGTLTIADPWSFFVLYHVYWPARFLECLYTGKEWSRINISTTKMFEA
ncbi:uncharacterized protein M421DRAFT_419363 [Didymella exigua CBS 183.55]|uniref:ATP-grasp domain-containing protein n=1 Tax=Didymella exigua CBS 183.55 TaxID=1150837 RepID=A0A6A5RQX2_9PLEO|nr:uncharacterized protein M421DRAFT_419363 [Didymella exigua CBS 183.55]KAF1929568.1 hypothetical protein M421DRAFT_419363 [Didymella exigua CBS 183.55]